MNATGSCRGLPEGGRRWKIKKKGGGQRLKGKGQAGPALREGRGWCFAPLVAGLPRSGVSALGTRGPPQPRRRLRKEGAGRTRSSSGLGTGTVREQRADLRASGEETEAQAAACLAVRLHKEQTSCQPAPRRALSGSLPSARGLLRFLPPVEKLLVAAPAPSRNNSREEEHSHKGELFWCHRNREMGERREP